MPNYPEPLTDVFHALADPTRRAVLSRLTTGPATVTELAAPFDMALPSFVQHLRVLEQSRLVLSEKRGRVRTCHIVPETLKSAEQWMEQQRVAWEHRLSALVEYVENNPDVEGEDHGEA